MIRYLVLASAATLASPVLAQTAPAPAQTTPTPVTGSATAPQTASPVAGDPVQVTDLPAATPQTAQPAADAAAQAQPAGQPATGSEVAQVVETEFPTYDKDGDGKLSRTEFGAWMVALKMKTDPATKADSPATRSWVGAAFGQADKDKSRSLTKAEVTGFLSQGQS